MAQRRGRRGRYRLLTPTERAAIEARFRAGAWVREVMAEFGVPHTSACRIQNEVALMRGRVVCSPPGCRLRSGSEFSSGSVGGRATARSRGRSGDIARPSAGRSAGAESAGIIGRCRPIARRGGSRGGRADEAHGLPAARGGGPGGARAALVAAADLVQTEARPS